MLFQRVKDELRIAVFISRVERQIQNLFVSISHITGVILSELFRSGVPCRGLTFFLKLSPQFPSAEAAMICSPEQIYGRKVCQQLLRSDMRQ